jgi:hypothetical protein
VPGGAKPEDVVFDAAPRTRADGSQRRRPANYAPLTRTVAVLAARTLLLTKLSNPM